jgi:hypothetical protein
VVRISGKSRKADCGGKLLASANLRYGLNLPILEMDV